MNLRPSAWTLMCIVAILQMNQRPQATEVQPAPANWQELNAEQRLTDVNRRRLEPLKSLMQQAGFSLGNPAYIRIHKEGNELELWLRKSGESKFDLFKTYPIAFYSGTLGPKQKEGDNQAPEGFYSATAKLMNPMSRYHLSFNIGYPNAYDRAHKRTGGLIMVHGKNVSIGCFAMTDPLIEEIYLIVEAALKAGQAQVPVHSFPFRMTAERMAQASDESSPWLTFWRELQPAWQAFEQSRQPPSWTVRDGRYLIRP